ncbi:hypothetical protein AS9A_2927 [Hoyosella subflava DQS3-9A1]|uniref:Uncharacterized protein n=1 Tax=Hoyosella subflava (strain DSM 45089 / JCM 17490 / NBRC 109087 / DQS3-9A1) TaxID=443218 RepID=F6EK16_HOYSD|nr:hypothetical protein AS9A_2927 [Hoyosella subflava DQS3-9A1]
MAVPRWESEFLGGRFGAWKVSAPQRFRPVAAQAAAPQLTRAFSPSRAPL